MKVLITGFGPFPGVPHNISSDLARYCAETWSRGPGIEATHISLATAWNTAPDAARAHLLSARPDILIHLGVSNKATHLVLESHAYNDCCDTLDAEGGSVAKPHLTDGHPVVAQTCVDLEAIGRNLRAAGHPVTISNDPGRYLCNAVYHTTLTAMAEANLQTKIMFVHIPTTFSSDTITQDEAIAGMSIVFAALSAD